VEAFLVTGVLLTIVVIGGYYLVTTGYRERSLNSVQVTG